MDKDKDNLNDDFEYEKEIVEEFYFSGKVKRTYSLVNSLIHGESILYYPNGKKASSLCFDMGILQGPAIEYGPKEIIVKEFNYKSNILDGFGKKFYSDGNLQETVFFVEGKIHGRNLHYYPNGTIEKDLYFNYGEPLGENVEFYSSGKLKTKSFYLDGKLNGKEYAYYPNAKLKMIANYKNGILNGRARIFYPNGVVEKSIIYKNGKLNGKCFLYNEMGNIKNIASYKNNQLQGKSILYNNNQKKEFIIQYEKNQIIGNIYEYYPNKEIKTISSLKNFGKELSFYKNGNIKKTFFYNVNFPTGIVMFYRKSSVLSNIIIYRNTLKEGLRVRFDRSGFVQKIYKLDNGNLSVFSEKFPQEVLLDIFLSIEEKTYYERRAFKKCYDKTGIEPSVLRELKKNDYNLFKENIKIYAIETMKEVGF